jgi:competence protein ComFA
MGAVRSCTRLAVWRGPEPVRPVPWGETDRLLVWTGSLSADQRRAASDLDHSLSMGRNFLLWAVCGSGKTEIMYPAIEHALLRGGKVVLATPRTDVVRELFPRLSAAFPEVPAAALYAGSDAARPDALLVVATTHQLIHYRDCFDCVFIDEVDAFPYSYDPMLAYAVKKAAKPDAPFAYVSATPPIELKNAFTSGKLSGANLSRRYHGHPLPEPVCRWIGEWRKKTARDGRLPAAFARWIQGKMAAGGRVLVFVPSRAMQRTVTERLQRLGAGSVAGVDAEDPDRYAKVGHFRENRIQVLVTTTILERGVTVSGVEVAVFGADDPIFDERALVQIAGRVGRSPQQPDGDVVFFHNGRTLEMLRAVRHIRQMNKEGGF